MNISKQSAALADFVSEMHDLTEAIILELSSSHNLQLTPETLQSIYRNIHTIKGNASHLGCVQISQIFHALEAVLDALRNGIAPLTADLIDTVLSAIDCARQASSGLGAVGAELDIQSELYRLIPRLALLIAPNPEGMAIPKDSLGLYASDEEDGESTTQASAPTVIPTAARPARIPLAEKRATKAASAHTGDKSDPKGTHEQILNDTVRVQVGLLDSLMNLVGELVLIRNQVIQHNNTTQDDAEFTNLSQRLNIVTTELQNEIMKTRMQPIGNILSKFHRIVRDLSRELGKDISLTLEGTETELDKTLVEAVKDPLTHIIRNSVDHGIETPDVRAAAGKDRRGHILIRSFHEGGQIVIEIRDDGKGLHRHKIGAKAVERGLVTADALKAMSDREVHSFIFAPGFSTADKVSNISGRGVGMDVVRTNIEKIGGMVELVSVENAGTTIRIKIPLTLAIVPALIVKAGQEQFAIPQVKLVELVRVDRNQEGSEIKMLQGQPVVLLRGNLLPLTSLNQVLKLDDGDCFLQREVVNITILRADQGYFGLIVDSIEDSTDIVVKPMSAFLKNIGIYSGATVLGDGSVALVLDVVGLAEKASVLDNKVMEGQGVGDPALNSAGELSEYLLTDLGTPSTYAIPLVHVKRLEEFNHRDIEVSGAMRVVRYRDSILPILSVVDLLGLRSEYKPSKTRSECVPVVVVERGGRQFGLEVESIFDIIGLTSEIDIVIKDRPCLLGTVSHADGILVVLDVYKMIEQAFPSSQKPSHLHEADEETARARQRFNILLVEDSKFFRHHIAEILTTAGYKVHTEDNGEDAWRRLEETNLGSFSLLLTDIEMPKMNGVQLAERVRANARFRSLPVLSLSSKGHAQLAKEGFDIHFDRCLEKLDAELLIHELDTILAVTGGRKYGT